MQQMSWRMEKSRTPYLGGILFALAFLVWPARSLEQTTGNGSVTLSGHVPSAVKNGTARLLYPASRQISTIDARVILPLQNQAQLDALLRDLYDPTGPTFRHFLTPVEFTQRFGASPTDSLEVREIPHPPGTFRVSVFNERSRAEGDRSGGGL